MEIKEIDKCQAVRKPTAEEQVEQYRKEIKELRKHCGKIEQENTVLQRLYNRQYNVAQDYANAMEECNERIDSMHYALYGVRNWLLSNDTKSRITKSEREELMKILSRAIII